MLQAAIEAPLKERMMVKSPQPPPGRETPTPDMNAGAPRPKHASDIEADVPDMDTPPRAQPGEEPTFDQGTKEADREARVGTVPGPDDFDARQKDDPTWHDEEE